MKAFVSFLLFCTSFNLVGKPLRDSVYIKTDIFEIVYSETLQQPRYCKYEVLCRNGTASREGMMFYTNDTIVTSDFIDYKRNVYDKGHLAPAADFNCTTEMLYKTFTYLNCALQHQDLNRTTWKYLEEHERELSIKYPHVVIEIFCNFSKTSKVLSTKATVPDSFTKIIRYGTNVEKYFFKNETPKYSDYKKYLVR